MKHIIAPSVLSADFAKLGVEIQAVERAGADWIHVDVMDGHFVPNISMGGGVLKSIRKITDMPLDVHLMIDSPEKFIPDFAKAGANIISIHPEATAHVHRALTMIKNHGCQAGLVLNPATPLCVLDHVWQHLDLILLMSVNPGFGGQAFIPETLEKAKSLKELIKAQKKSILIEVDGGVNSGNAKALVDAGVDVLVAGSAIFGSSDYTLAVKQLR